MRKLLVVVAVLCFAVLPGKPAHAVSGYDAAVLADKPVLFYSRATSDYWFDAASGFTAKFPYGHGSMRSPRGVPTPFFNGTSQYAFTADRGEFSVTHTGVLTIEAWIAPATLKFPHSQRGYVWWSGKGDRTGNFEWATRMYSADNVYNRENRISGYVFGPQGGLGAGSFYQQPVTTGEWIHYVFVINTRAKSERYPLGYTRLYIDGRFEMERSIALFPNSISKNGNAKLRIGTRDSQSHFKGGIGKYALYNHELPAESVTKHHTTPW